VGTNAGTELGYGRWQTHLSALQELLPSAFGRNGDVPTLRCRSQRRRGNDNRSTVGGRRVVLHAGRRAGRTRVGGRTETHGRSRSPAPEGVRAQSELGQMDRGGQGARVVSRLVCGPVGGPARASTRPRQ